MKKVKYTLATLMVAAIVAVVLVGCKKEKEESNNQKTPQEMLVSTSEGKGDKIANPYEKAFAQYSKSYIEALFEVLTKDPYISYEKWMAKANSIQETIEMPSFSSVNTDLLQLADDNYIQMLNSFFMNLGTLDVNHSAEIAEKQFISSNCNPDVKNACLYSFACVKTMLQSVEDLQYYLPGSGYDRYLDCMRNHFGNNNPIDWIAFIVGCPASLGWQIASCIWDVTHQEE